MRYIENESGRLLEIPICWSLYIILCAILIPNLLKFQSVFCPLAILVPIGLLASFMAGLALSESRLTFFKVPPSVWSYLVLAGLSLLAILWINPKIIVFVIVVLPFISYAFAMLASGLFEKKG